jgi:hypothetical protein
VSSRIRTVCRASGVLDDIEDSGNPQRLYAKLVLQTEDEMR